MAEEQTAPFLDFDLGEFGGQIRIDTIGDLSKWCREERNVWGWLGSETIRYWMGEVVTRHEQFYTQVERAYNLYTNRGQSQEGMKLAHDNVISLFQTSYCTGRLFHNSNPKAKFVFELKEKRGDIAAAGAYAALLSAPFAAPPGYGNTIQTLAIEGVIEGFLFQQEIKWTASAHQKTLLELESKVRENISAQQARATEIENQNTKLNHQFTETLNQSATALTTRHAEQAETFKTVIAKHEKQIIDLEETYNRKLALQAPVKYWEDKETFHKSRLRIFGWLVVIVPAGLAAALMCSIYYLLVHDVATENPKHWEIGILVVAAFFAVWFSRIIVRLFLSHHHLATDASERKILIQTYLSLSREGAPYAPDDRKIILTQIFRNASDGLVKDDATPKTPMELFTRS